MGVPRTRKVELRACPISSASICRVEQALIFCFGRQLWRRADALICRRCRTERRFRRPVLRLNTRDIRASAAIPDAGAIPPSAHAGAIHARASRLHQRVATLLGPSKRVVGRLPGRRNPHRPSRPASNLTREICAFVRTSLIHMSIKRFEVGGTESKFG